MNTIVFLGLTTLDIINYVGRYPQGNEKIRASEQLIFAGGPAANAAITCATLGSSVTLITGLGDTPLAGLVKDDLLCHNLRLVDCINEQQQLPVLSTIIVDESSGDRSVVYTDPTTRVLRNDVILDSVLDDTQAILFDGFYLEQAVKLGAIAKRQGIPVILDGGSWKDGLDQLLPYVDIAICSQNFFPPTCIDVLSVREYLLSYGIKKIAVSRGSNAIYAWDRGIEKQIDIRPTKACDTLGAGDILHGAFCHYMSGYDFFSSLQMAAGLASLSCTYRGTRQWIEHYRKGH